MDAAGSPLPCARVDRHAHLEGSLDPTWVRQQAVAAGLAPPASLEALWRREPVPFEGFIEAFLFACGFLRDAGAVRAALQAAVLRLPPAGPDGPRGIDLWVSPHFLVRQGRFLALDQLWRGLDDGIRDARAQGVQVAVVVEAVNHLGPGHGHEVLDLVLDDRPGWIVGFSTGGLERVPFRDWAPVFDRARRAGLLLAAHAGENGPGSNVRDAILEAGVTRIVHGVRAAAHPEIVELLAARRIPVDICISSNRALVPDLSMDPRETPAFTGGSAPAAGPAPRRGAVRPGHRRPRGHPLHPARGMGSGAGPGPYTGRAAGRPGPRGRRRLVSADPLIREWRVNSSGFHGKIAVS